MSRRDLSHAASHAARRLADRRMVSVAWASVLTLFAIAALLTVRAELEHRAQVTRAAQVQADILAASTGAALAFDDRSAMKEYVDALRVNREVAAAAVYDAAGRAVVVYHRDGIATPPSHVGATRTTFTGRHAAVVRPVTQQGARLGSVYLETQPEPWTLVLGRHSGLAVLTLLALLLLGVVTAAAAQLQARARLLAEANARLVKEMAARSEAEEALRQSQKMEALGRLTGGIAHDFNNLLQVVHGAFELIRRKPEDAGKVVVWSKNGLEAAERGASLTRQLLAFSRSQKLELRPFVVAELIDEMRNLLGRTLGAEIALSFDLDEAGAAVMSDRTQLELAVLNLAINARDAMPDGGRLTIATRVCTLTGEAFLEPGDYVALSVADTGEGMSPEVVERAFDPFFTTKQVGQGTGLGLSQVYGVARQAGGAARIESTPGAGTTVTLYLRRSTASPEAPQANDGHATVLAPTGGRTILVVDDEEAVRALAADILQLLGYRVLQADGGAKALDMLSATRPDLMLFDYAMPDMNGAELARRARDLAPGVPIVFASGYADTEALESSVGGEAVILKKPFDMDTLARTVGTLLRHSDAR
ncbi:MAG: response regulator [Proteobacteria bacterium]|nr:response regulator [Pseudomonadota bacterium]